MLVGGGAVDLLKPLKASTKLILITLYMEHDDLLEPNGTHLISLMAI